MIEKIFVKCSSCGVEAVTQEIGQGYPYTCGKCNKITMDYVGNLKELQQQRNKWNRRISILKKVKLEKE